MMRSVPPSGFGPTRRWIVLAAAVLFTGLAGAGVHRLRISNELRDTLPDQDPVVRADRRASEHFGRTYVLTVGVEGPAPFHPNALRAVGDVTQRLRVLPGVAHVLSLSSLKYIEDDAGELRTKPFVSADHRVDAAARTRLRSDPGLRSLWGDDGRSFLVVAEINRTANQAPILAAAQALQAAADPSIELHLGGDIVLLRALSLGTQRDAVRLIPVGLVLLGLLVFLIYRRVRAAFAVISVTGLSCLWTLGAMGFAGEPLSVVTSLVPVFVVVACGSYAIHLTQLWATTPAGTHLDPVAALGASWRALRRPILLAGLTTGIAALSLLNFALAPIRAFGCWSAVGVAFSCLAALAGMPILLGAPSPQPTRGAAEQVLRPLHRFLRRLGERHARAIQMAALASALLAVPSILRIDVELGAEEALPAAHPVRSDAEWFRAQFGISSVAEIVIDSGRPGGAFAGPVQGAAAALVAHLESNPKLRSGPNLPRVLHSLRRALDLPSDRAPADQNAQLTMLAESAWGPESVARFVDGSRQRLRIPILMRDASNADAAALMAAVERAAEPLRAQGITVHTGGGPLLALAASRYVVRGKMENAILALLLLGLLLSIVHRSPRVALTALVPLAWSAVALFGLMGLLQIPLNAATALITSVSLGVGIDFAVHYLAADKRRAHDPAAIDDCGAAILADAGSNLCGFSAALLSSFLPLIQFGILACLSMVLAAVATLVLLPALLQRAPAQARRAAGTLWTRAPSRVSP